MLSAKLSVFDFLAMNDEPEFTILQPDDSRERDCPDKAPGKSLWRDHDLQMRSSAVASSNARAMKRRKRRLAQAAAHERSAGTDVEITAGIRLAFVLQ
jgi:hypothetical protein